jgi:hypothetical protein
MDDLPRLFRRYWRPSSATNTKHDTQVTVRFANVLPGGTVHYLAAAPADYRTTFTGSGLPFHNLAQAFGETPNTGTCTVDGTGGCVIHLLKPNSFHEIGGAPLRPPCMLVKHGEAYDVFSLGAPIPFRAIARDPTATSPEFYVSRRFVATQDEILHTTAYPSCR